MFLDCVRVFTDRQVQMGFVAHEDERRPLFRLHPELDIVQQSCEYARDDGEHVRRHFGEIHHLNAVLSLARGKQLCDLLREPVVLESSLWRLEHKAVPAVLRLGFEAGDKPRQFPVPISLDLRFRRPRLHARIVLSQLYEEIGELVGHGRVHGECCTDRLLLLVLQGRVLKLPHMSCKSRCLVGRVLIAAVQDHREHLFPVQEPVRQEERVFRWLGEITWTCDLERGGNRDRYCAVLTVGRGRERGVLAVHVEHDDVRVLAGVCTFQDQRHRAALARAGTAEDRRVPLEQAIAVGDRGGRAVDDEVAEFEPLLLIQVLAQ